MVLPGAALCPFQGPAPSCPCKSHLPVGGRGSNGGDEKELCLLRPRRLQCQRKGAFKGHFWLGRPAHPQIQNKNRSGAPDGLVSPAPQKGLVESEGQVARQHTGQGTLASGSVWPTCCGPGLVLRWWQGTLATTGKAGWENHPQDSTQALFVRVAAWQEEACQLVTKGMRRMSPAHDSPPAGEENGPRPCSMGPSISHPTQHREGAFRKRPS